MKKICFAFYNDQFPEAAVEFICRMNAASPVLLTIISLQKQEEVELPTYADGTFGMFLPLTQHRKKSIQTSGLQKLERICIENGVQYQLREDASDITLAGLQKESQFSELLVMGSEMIYGGRESESINVMLEDLLHQISCPAILIPEKFDFPTSLVLAYDGSEDCVFAIRQFAFLFPELLGLNTLLTYISNDASNEIPHENEIESLAGVHFSNITFCKMESKKEFTQWMIERRSSMLVCGSYGRSALSQLIRKSFARNIIANSQVPVFIAHR
ncbi:MAG: universal stress protein [Bacteroidota bacterium]